CPNWALPQFTVALLLRFTVTGAGSLAGSEPVWCGRNQKPSTGLSISRFAYPESTAAASSLATWTRRVYLPALFVLAVVSRVLGTNWPGFIAASTASDGHAYRSTVAPGIAASAGMPPDGDLSRSARDAPTRRGRRTRAPARARRTGRGRRRRGGRATGR